MSVYSRAPEVAAITDTVIQECQPDLVEAKILCLFVDRAPKRGGHKVLAQLSQLGGLAKYLSRYAGDKREIEFDFVLKVSAIDWSDMTDRRRRALLDHALSHGRWHEGTWKMVSPDVQEFIEVVRRRGTWTEKLEELVAAAEQLTIDLRHGGRSD